MNHSIPLLALSFAFALPGAAQAQTCQPTPERLIVLGDSIVACAGVGGADGADCSPRLFHESLNEGWAPGITYENLSVGGAVTSHVPNRQMPQIDIGPGHALVLIYIGGNDISPYLFLPDGAAEASFPGKMEDLEESWSEIFAFLDDPANFPDGVTVVINQQYNPFDDCYGTSDTKVDLLSLYNDMLIGQTASRDNALTADPYSVFLGHGHNYQRRSCPYYERDSDYWMGDLIHPNAAGHNALADIWGGVADDLYGQCRGRGLDRP